MQKSFYFLLCVDLASMRGSSPGTNDKTHSSSSILDESSIPGRRRTKGSNVWTHFEQFDLNSHSAACLECGRTIKTYMKSSRVGLNPSTSNFWTHLKTYHNILPY